MAAQRNETCPCGSGKKFKHCCSGKRRSSSQWLALVSVAVFALAAVWVVAGIMRGSADPPAAAPDVTAGRVWSEEHGHYHDQPGSPGTPRPAGPAPPGKVWSAEHGHWHDSVGDAPGPPPPGKVWSEEHGHWHDAPTAAAVAAQPVDIPESSVSFVDD